MILIPHISRDFHFYDKVFAEKQTVKGGKNGLFLFLYCMKGGNKSGKYGKNRVKGDKNTFSYFLFLLKSGKHDIKDGKKSSDADILA